VDRVVELPVVSPRPPEARSQWSLAARRLARNRVALAALVIFMVILGVSFAAPLYARHVAHTNPFVANPGGSVVINGHLTALLQSGKLGLGETPIGPTWTGKYFLGADAEGRDVAARILYGGRASLLIGIGSAAICSVLALSLGLAAGFAGGWLDAVLSRLMDVLWAFPVYLIAISLATVLTTSGLKIGPVQVNPSSLWLPTMIIGIIYVPYMFRPIRGQVLSARQKDYVDAAIAVGAGDLRLVVEEILPNVISVVIVLFPLIIATNILTESALSFLGIGVQPPNASWGTIIADGQNLLYTRPWVSIAPGIMIVLIVLTLNIFGDGLRDALDPRAKVKVGR
jgi:peptide/nickel transport system permease protein